MMQETEAISAMRLVATRLVAEGRRRGPARPRPVLRLAFLGFRFMGIHIAPIVTDPYTPRDPKVVPVPRLPRYRTSHLSAYYANAPRRVKTEANLVRVEHLSPIFISFGPVTIRLRSWR